MVGAQVAALILLAQAAPAAGPEGAAVPQASAAPATASKTVSPITVTPQKPISKRREVNPDEVTCHDELPPGTRFAIRVCATNRQFAERTRDQQQIVRDWQNTPITTKAQ